MLLFFLPWVSTYLTAWEFGISLQYWLEKPADELGDHFVQCGGNVGTHFTPQFAAAHSAGHSPKLQVSSLNPLKMLHVDQPTFIFLAGNMFFPLPWTLWPPHLSNISPSRRLPQRKVMLYVYG